MYISPNPVVAGSSIQLQMHQMPEGIYTCRLVDETGKILKVQQVIHAGGNASHEIEQAGIPAAGTFLAEITATGK